MADEEITFEMMAKAAHREVGQRKRVYPRFVIAGSMTREKAKYEIAVMQAIAEHFDRLVAEQKAKGDLFGGQS